MTAQVFPRTVSRLAAIQATFQRLLRPSVSIHSVIQDFIIYRFKPEGYALFQDDDFFTLDQDFFTFIAQGADTQGNAIEAAIAPALPNGWKIDHMENTTRAIFRCAGFEAQACPSTPKRVILNEYITAAHCFLLDKGHGLINAVLDKSFDALRSASQSVETPCIEQAAD
jgi:N utilization substance protein B